MGSPIVGRYPLRTNAPLQYAELLTALLPRYSKRGDASRRLDIPTITIKRPSIGGNICRWQVLSPSCPVRTAPGLEASVEGGDTGYHPHLFPTFGALEAALLNQ